MKLSSASHPGKTAIVTRNTIVTANKLSDVRKIVAAARQANLSHIGFSFAFIHNSSDIFLKNTIIHDLRSIQPVKLAIVLVETQSPTKVSYRQFVVGNLQQPKLVKALKPLFELEVTFASNKLKTVFFCLSQLGMPEPRTVWDCQICEQALHLGRYYHKYAPNQGNGVAARISAKTWASEQRSFQTSLMCTCQRYGVPYQLPPQTPIGDQSDNFVATALAAAKLYGHQVATAKAAGIHEHLVTVEMPFVETVARWNGQGSK